MESIGDMTVREAELRLEAMNREAVAIRDWVKKARSRVHEFAPATQDYDITLLTLTLDEIDKEFAAACAKTKDPHGLAARTGLTVEEVQEMGQRVRLAPTNLLRLVVKRGDATVSYSLPFQSTSCDFANNLLDKFWETLKRHGWEIVERRYVERAEEGDVILAGV